MNDTFESIAAVRDGKPVRVYVVCTGAGAGLQRLLWDTPGTSGFLAGAAFPYAEEDTSAFLGFEPEKFCDGDTAIELAMAAYTRAWTPHIDNALGIGLTAVVATDRRHRGKHRVYVSSFSRDGCVLTSAILKKGVGGAARQIDGDISDRLGLNALLAAVGVETLDLPGVDSVTTDATARAGELFMRRRFFAANGTRSAAPPAAVHFPGTYDPPHRGHWDIAERLRGIGRKVVFSITVDPPHKQSLAVPVMLERAKMLCGKDRLFTSGDALYLDKARRWRTDFAIGTDALARMLDPCWGVEPGALLAEFDRLGTRFFVAERKLAGEILRLNGLSIPERYAHLFVNLGPCWSESSTALRAALTAG